MKQLLYIGLFLLVWGCEKNEVPVYDLQKSSIQFNYKADAMKLDYDFAFQYETEKDPWGYEYRYYYGDSLQRDTISLYISALGFAEGQDREFSLKTVPVKGQDSTLLADIEFLPSYHLRANHLIDTIQVVLLRPAQRGRYTIGITFDLDADSAFELGVEEQNVYQVNISDRYPKPYDWSEAEYYLGEYSEEKYAFYVTVLQKPLEFWAFWDNAALRQALDEYNAANPDSPKDFTFPVLDY